jgi:hypothetical protein
MNKIYIYIYITGDTTTFTKRSSDKLVGYEGDAKTDKAIKLNV